MKRICFFMLMAMMAIAIPVSFSACGGDDDLVNEPHQNEIPNNGGGGNNGQNTNNSSENDPVMVKCYTCYGSAKCPTCNGMGKGCKLCNGTGKYCSYCNSTGDCKECHGEKKCQKCGGTKKMECGVCRGRGSCTGCNGTGHISTMAGYVSCPTCNGKRNCIYCDRGKVNCTQCEASGNCYLCKGSGNCSVCNGEPKCKECGGDGHCPDCKNSDGKCVTCGGTGYLLVDFVLSDTSLEFSGRGGTKTITITSNTDWKVTKDVDWIVISPDSGNGNAEIYVIVFANDGFARKATITFTHGSTRVDVIISQEASEAMNTMSLEDMLIHPLGTVNVNLKTASYQQVLDAMKKDYDVREDYNYHPSFHVFMGYNPQFEKLKYHGLSLATFSGSDFSSRVSDPYRVYHHIFFAYKSELSDPYALLDQIVADFKAEGIPISYKREQYNGNLASGSYGRVSTDKAEYSISLDEDDITYTYLIGTFYYY